jgi:hypothetical protein
MKKKDTIGLICMAGALFALWVTPYEVTSASAGERERESKSAHASLYYVRKQTRQRLSTRSGGVFCGWCLLGICLGYS